MMIVRHHHPHNGHGWRLDLKQCYDPATLTPGRPPLVIVPGYGMNAFIFGFHPTGKAMERYFVDAGFEVWSVNLRGQGTSKHLSGPLRYGFRELALIDLPCVFDVVLDQTRTGADHLTPVGCSLGATINYIYLAHNRDSHRAGAMISIGGPLRWEQVHPAVRLLFTSPSLAGAIPIKGTRRMASLALPVARRVPALMSLYMNARHIDLSQADKLVQTVEDPNRYLNRQIAHWIKGGDLVVDGLNVSHALRDLPLDVMVILANADGVVPPAAARSVVDVLGNGRVEVLEVGDKDTPFAHADLFVSRLSQDQVFQPLVDWLNGHEGSAPPRRAAPRG